MRLTQMTVLSDKEIKQIHDASVEILETTGVKVDSPDMLRALADKGLDVDTEQQLVRFSRASIEDAVAGAPSSIEVFDRTGKPAFVLGDGQSKIAGGHNGVFWVDTETGKTRNSTVADIDLFSRICDELECIDVISTPAMPQDVSDPASSLLHAVSAIVTNSTKPVFFSTDGARINRAVIDLLEAAYEGDFAKEVYGITQLSPTSPLRWERGVLDAIADTLTTAVPIAILPEPNAGVSCPYTLAGLLTMNNAECLSGIAMIQILKPGTPILYANSWTTVDMRSGAALVGSTETTICRIAAAQLGRFYKVPSHTTAPNSDNHAHDEQAAWERTYSLFCSVAAGNDLVVNCGMFASGMTSSHEQLVMDEEIAAMARRICRGIDVSDGTIAQDLIMRTAHSAEYLTADHTLEHLRSGEYIQPRLSVRGPRASWEAEGSKDTYQLARDKVREYESSTGTPIDPARTARINEIIRSFSR